MRDTAVITILTLLLTTLCVQLRKDFIRGIAFAVFICVSMTTYLRVSLPGNLPELTIFRMVLIILFIFWRKQPKAVEAKTTPLWGFFCFWAIANVFSLVFTSIDFIVSLKRFLDFVAEIGGFYIIVSSSIKSRSDGLRILEGAFWGVSLVALLAFVEKYTAINPAEMLAFHKEASDGPYRDVVASYQHRILLGTGMAMGVPLGFLYLLHEFRPGRRKLVWVAICLLTASCYFSQSRGPWMGLIFAGMILIGFGTMNMRRHIAVIMALSVLVLIAKPGVFTTLFESAKVTADQKSFKGGTFRYRLELWKVAWNEITVDPIRFLFGYGQGCGSETNIEWKLSYRQSSMEIWSWDNQYAYDLFQTGVVGFTASFLLYLAVTRKIYGLWRKSVFQEQEVLACLLASGTVFVFMLSNVLIFAKQLNFLFWTVAIVGLSFRFPEEESVHLESSTIENECPTVLVSAPI